MTEIMPAEILMHLSAQVPSYFVLSIFFRGFARNFKDVKFNESIIIAKKERDDHENFLQCGEIHRQNGHMDIGIDAQDPILIVTLGLD
jgi:hypothetical protein